MIVWFVKLIYFGFPSGKDFVDDVGDKKRLVIGQTLSEMSWLLSFLFF